jgi:hypothetical protein
MWSVILESTLTFLRLRCEEAVYRAHDLAVKLLNIVNDVRQVLQNKLPEDFASFRLEPLLEVLDVMRCRAPNVNKQSAAPFVGIKSFE